MKTISKTEITMLAVRQEVLCGSLRRPTPLPDLSLLPRFPLIGRGWSLRNLGNGLLSRRSQVRILPGVKQRAWSLCLHPQPSSCSASLGSPFAPLFIRTRTWPRLENGPLKFLSARPGLLSAVRGISLRREFLSATRCSPTPLAGRACLRRVRPCSPAPRWRAARRRPNSPDRRAHG